MCLRLVPFVFVCFTERLGASHQNLGFHYNQIPNHWLETNIQVIWQHLEHLKATNIFVFGLGHIPKPQGPKYQQ
jgi:hypothetical protein